MLEMCVILEVMGRPAQFATSYMIGREDKRTNNRTMLPSLTLKNNAAASYQGPVKTELLKGAGLLKVIPDFQTPKIGLKKRGAESCF